MHQVTRKAASAEWSPEQEGSLTGLSCLPAALPLEPIGPADPVVLELSVTDRDTVGSRQAQQIGRSSDPWDFGAKPAILCRQLLSF